MSHADLFTAKKDRLPQNAGAVFLEILLAGRAVAADVAVVVAAAQQDQDPDPGEIVIKVIIATIVVATQTQQDDDPNDATFVTTAKSTHNKIPP